MPQPQDGALVGQPLVPGLQTLRTRGTPAYRATFFHRRVAQREPLLHEVDAQPSLAREPGGRPRLPCSKKGDTKITRLAQGTTFSISSSNSRRRVGLAVCPKPRLCCFMLRIVLVLHVDAKQVVRRFMQTGAPGSSKSFKRDHLNWAAVCGGCSGKSGSHKLETQCLKNCLKFRQRWRTPHAITCPSYGAGRGVGAGLPHYR